MSSDRTVSNQLSTTSSWAMTCLLLQLAQGLAERAAADVQRIGQELFVDPIAGAKLHADDLLAQIAVNSFSQSLMNESRFHRSSVCSFLVRCPPPPRNGGMRGREACAGRNGSGAGTRASASVRRYGDAVEHCAGNGPNLLVCVILNRLSSTSKVSTIDNLCHHSTRFDQILQ